MSISGKYLTALVGVGAIEGTHEWSVSERADRLEATTGANNGRGKKDAGVVDTVIRITFYLDITTGEYLFVRAGGTLANLALYADADAEDPLYLFSSVTIFDCEVRGQIRDRFIVTAELEPNGDVVVAENPNPPA